MTPDTKKQAYQLAWEFAMKVYNFPEEERVSLHKSLYYALVGDEDERVHALDCLQQEASIFDPLPISAEESPPQKDPEPPREHENFMS